VDRVAEVGAQLDRELARHEMVAAKVVELVHRLAELDARRVERRDDAARRADDVRPHRRAEEQHEALHEELVVRARVDLARAAEDVVERHIERDGVELVLVGRVGDVRLLDPGEALPVIVPLGLRADALKAPEAREPVREYAGEARELDERHRGEREPDVVLPPVDDARGAHDAHELQDAEDAQQAQQPEVDLVARGRRDPGDDELEWDASEKVEEEPSAQVGDGDRLVVVDHHAALLRRRAHGREEGNDDVDDEDGVDDAVEREVERARVKSRLVEAHLERRDDGSDEQCADDDDVPDPHVPRRRVERALA